MKLRVLFFGATADATGVRSTYIELAEDGSGGSLLKRLRAQFPGLENLTLLIAVNEEYSESDAVLKNDDEVAVFTAVSGG